MNFYRELKDIRKEKGFTIREVADRSGVSPAYISQLENGNRGLPSPDILMKLSEGLNISYSTLMGLAGYLEESVNIESAPKLPLNLRRVIRENELMFDGIHLTEEDKEWVERMLTVLFWKEKKHHTDNHSDEAPASST